MSRTDPLGPEAHRLPHLAFDTVDEMLGGKLPGMLAAAETELASWSLGNALLDAEDVARMDSIGREISNFVREVLDSAEKRDQAMQAAVMTLWLRAFLNHRRAGTASIAVAPAAASALLQAPLLGGRDAAGAAAACVHVICVAPEVLELAADYLAVRGFEAPPTAVEFYVMRLDSSRDAHGKARDAGGVVDVHVFFGCRIPAPVYAARELRLGENSLEEAIGQSTRLGEENAGDIPLRHLLRLGLGAWLRSAATPLRPLESSVADRFAPRGFGKGKFEKFMKARRTITQIPVAVLDA